MPPCHHKIQRETSAHLFFSLGARLVMVETPFNVGRGSTSVRKYGLAIEWVVELSSPGSCGLLERRKTWGRAVQISFRKKVMWIECLQLL